jgi:selenide, water dikinase
MIKLLEYSKSSGCGCKLAPAELEILLQGNDLHHKDELLIKGSRNNEDAAVYDLQDGKLLVSTTDFFTPIVNDPFDFGRIAAANAISDVYAMGANPIFALAILGWPVSQIPVHYASQVMAGARKICTEAGIQLAGGHSIESSEPIFGLVVNGLATKETIRLNSSAKEGDYLFLTKPIGTGILSSAMRREIITPAQEEKMIEVMCTLNNAGFALGNCKAVNSLTDITGFGLLGHLIEMAEGSNLTAEIENEKVPLIKGVKELAEQFVYPDITTKNFSAFAKKTKGMDGLEFITLCDPQSNGPLLVAVDEVHKDDYIRVVSAFDAFGVATQAIGRMKKAVEGVAVELTVR